MKTKAMTTSIVLPLCKGESEGVENSTEHSTLPDPPLPAGRQAYKREGISQPNIKDIPLVDWPALFAELGLKKFTATQVFQWIFQKGAGSFEEMSNLSKETRKVLAERFTISHLKVVDTLEDPDGTKKFLFELEDGERIESVLIPNERGRVTLCISSQVGCALGCEFCRTATLGFKRNLKVSEIIDQVLAVRFQGHPLPSPPPSRGREYLDPYQGWECVRKDNFPSPLRGEGQGGGGCGGNELSNIVFMGMGEPLNNYENVKAAIALMTDQKGLVIAPRRITLSTAGIVPQILQMGKDKLNVKLAISLNATTDEVRRKLMPITKKYSIDDIIDACLIYHPRGARWRTTFEYVMIKDLNDSMDDAKRLTKILQRLPSKVNLIPFNPFPGSDYRTPEEDTLKKFYNYLYNKGIQVNTRKSRGQKILAACGQLAAKG